jgi:hypothetical protein
MTGQRYVSLRPPITMQKYRLAQQIRPPDAHFKGLSYDMPMMSADTELIVRQTA